LKTKIAKPFLRWAGSKRKQLPILSRFWNSDFTRYVEPFMGSACLCFELQPKNALLGDVNYDLVRTFLTVRDHPQAVANRLAKIPRGRRSYYSIRSQRLSEMDAADAAARFIFLNRYCFNGLYRTNEAGQFNVPFAPTGTGQLATAADLLAVSKALKSCTIKHEDFESILERTRPGDLVYLDPPYAVGNRRIFRQYGPSSFGLHDLQRLAESLVAMDARNVKFVLSYANCVEATKFFNQWPRRKMFVQRNIAGFGGDRRRAGEVLISNCFPEDIPHN
jgi:DNA adenine methylase